jgi:hypothetical protein
MPETSENFYAALKARILNDAGLSSWATGHFGKGFTAIDGREHGQVREDEYPAAVLDLRESDQEDVILGGELVRIGATIIVVIVWREETPANVLPERLQLHDLLRKALGSDPFFSNTVNQARAVPLEVEGTKEPIFAVGIGVIAEYDLEVVA